MNTLLDIDLVNGVCENVCAFREECVFTSEFSES
jgi:hypothetical protein